MLGVADELAADWPLELVKHDPWLAPALGRETMIGRTPVDQRSDSPEDQEPKTMRPTRLRFTLGQMTVVATVGSVIAWLALAATSSAQQTPPGKNPPAQATKGRKFSGRVVDGLGRPVPGVKITVEPDHKLEVKGPPTVLQTGDDGRYSGTIASDHDPWLTFERDGYGTLSVDAAVRDEFTLNRKVDWEEASTVPYLDGDDLDHGVRELLASEEWELHDDHLLGLLFENQNELRPALRRLIRDLHVGASARDWLDLLDHSEDRDLFIKGRQYAPKKEVKETDLIEALKATARQRNFFTKAPEPSIKIDFIVFTRDLDQVLIQCGVNRVAMTGFTWQFVFRKAGKLWELRSAKQAGRS
jgi:hypothetical protein